LTVSGLSEFKVYYKNQPVTFLQSVVTVSPSVDQIDLSKCLISYFSQADAAYKTLSSSNAISFDNINQLLQLQVVAYDTYGNVFSVFPTDKQSLFQFALTGDIWTTSTPINFDVITKNTQSLNV